MTKLSKDAGAGAGATLHPRENLFISGALAATNAIVQCNADGASTVLLNVVNTYVGTIAVEGTIDNVNWFPIPIKPVNGGGIYVLTLASAAIGQWQGAIGMCQQVRARMSAFTSGSAGVILVANNGVTDVTAIPRAADQSVTVTAATGATATLTLPAAGAGFFHYISRLLIQRHTSALLTAGATPTIITTTNMPGSRAFSVPADAAAQGVLYQEFVEPAVPLRSSAANTATTFVAPLTTGVIWRMTADYYVGA